ncbi:MAG: outer membrane beta-barrel protein [Bacteroidales bacterium]|nr:outer membrane beta-barrel protein [Bacteroidales bacterium]
MKRIALFILVNTLCLSAMSQLAEVGVFGGGSFYMGDLNPDMPFYKTKAAYGVCGRYNFGERLAVKLDGKYAGLAASNGDRNVLPHMADSNFDTKAIAISVTGEWNYLDYFIGSKKSNFTPYLFGGFGFQSVKTITDANDIAKIEVEGQKTYAVEENFLQQHLIFPFGFGVKMNLTKKIGLNFDWTMVKTLSDLVDKQRHNTINGEQLTNKSTKDWYSFAGITLLYRIDTRKKTRCYGMQRDF